MSKKLASNRKRRPNDERLFVIVAVVGSLMIGAGFCALLVVLNHRDQTASDSLDELSHAQPVVIQPDHARQLVNFSLTDRSGKTVTRGDVAGEFLVVDFLFTSCSLTCPVVNKQMAEIQQLTTNQPDVKLVSLTVDPRDDTPDVLAKYGERFGADTNRWLLLTGEKTQLYNLIGTSFLAADLDDPFTYMPGNFSHTERIAIVDPRGNVRAYFDGLSQNVADAVVKKIAELRK
ncbi:MAG TPA: SCO family protein [Verrucomicrobiae bacterium]|nr:SCO family protein [Verrucomicrobiae bacterium]